MKQAAFLGIDVGSISTNLVITDISGNVIESIYLRGTGDPIGSVQKGFKKINGRLSEDFYIKGVCTTGSARSLIGAVVGADIIKNEIMTHAKATLPLHPETRTIFEIGGQDSKITIIRDGIVIDFTMNLVCAAGTGSFLDSQAKRLGISIESISKKALLSKNPTDIAGRCTVFAESDMIHKQQIGHNQNDIIMGLCNAMARNFLNNVCRGKDIIAPVVLQGGISANKGIKRAFEEALGTDIIIPEHHMVMGAFGAALIAASAEIETTGFRGFEISEHDISTSSFNCEDCPNMCEIIKIKDHLETIGTSGGSCGKWEDHSGSAIKSDISKKVIMSGNTSECLPNNCDVVIIGAGIGGLTAGAILSKAGFNTVILESGAQPGGYLACFERNGFRFDSSIHWLSQCGPGGFVKNIFNYIGHDMPECPQLHRLHRFIGDSFDYTLTSKPIDLRDQLIQDFPEDKDGILRFFNDAEKLGERLKVLNYRVQNKETMTFLEKTVYSIKMFTWVLPVLRHIRTPVDKALKNYFKSDRVRAIFASQETFMSVIVPIAWAFIENYQTVPTGGSSTLTKWLNDKIISHGSRIFLRQRVERVLVDDKNTVAGVQLAGGNTISSKYVIAACDIQALYNIMLPKNTIPARLKAAVNNAELYMSSFSVYLGLDCDPRHLGFGEEVLNLTVTNQDRKDHSSGDPHRSVLMVVSSSVRDSSMSPKGKGSIMIQCLADINYKKKWATEENFSRGRAYEKLKAEFADILLDRVEKSVAPDLRKHIEIMETASPVTYWRYTGNADGTILGSKPTAKNINSRVSHYKTPVKNLFMGGHCAEYGGGVPLAVKAGANSSLMILKDMKHKDFINLKRVMEGKIS